MKPPETYECIRKEDCLDGKTCANGYCVHLCRKDQDCTAPNICNLLALPATCVEPDKGTKNIFIFFISIPNFHFSNGSLNKTPSFIIKIKIQGCESDEDCSGERICENLTGTTVCCQPFQGISYGIKSIALCLH